jgi:uncharacterized membrane protein
MGKSENRPKDWPKDWSVTLTPHRSLSREGFVAVMAIVAFISLAAGLMFFVIGAWPIAGFLGLDVLLVWWAFRRNFADAKRAERITATGDNVILSRIRANGASDDTHFNRRWLRVELEYDEFRELVGRLLLKSHDVSHEIASFLGAEERQSLAKALRRAL